MSDLSHQQNLDRPRRIWLTETLLVAAILVFGGFALLSDARLTPSDMLTGVTQIFGR